MYPWLTRKLFDRLDALLRRISLFNMVCAPVRDLLNMFGCYLAEELGQPVMVTIPGTNIRSLDASRFAAQDRTRDTQVIRFGGVASRRIGVRPMIKAVSDA